MDLVALAYYALICAALAGVVATAGQRRRNIAVGAAVGLVAAAVLPVLRGAIGF